MLKTLADARLITTSEDTAEVAHEALIREWPTLRQWLAEDREGLRLHRHLTEAAQAWDELERDPGELYRGARLAQTQEWAEAHARELNPLEQTFLDASRAFAEREEAEREAQRQRELEAAQKLAESEKRRAEEQGRAAWRLRRRAVFLTGALVVAGALAVVAGAFGQQAQSARLISDANVTVAVAAQATSAANAAIVEREAEVNHSLALAAQSQLALNANNSDLALALAMAANRIDQPPAQAQLALSEAAYAPGTIRRFAGHQAPVWSVAISPDGRYGLSGSGRDTTEEPISEDNSVRLWDLQTGAEVRRLEGHTDTVSSVAFSPDGRYALSGSWDKSLILWDLTTGEIARRLIGHESPVWTVAISPDGRTALSGSGRCCTLDPVADDNSLRVWNLQTGKETRRFELHTDAVTSVVFSSDGRAALSGSWDKNLILFDVETGKVLLHTTAPGWVFSVDISPDGRRAFSDADFFVIVWDLESGEEIHRMAKHSSNGISVAINPDGRTGISADGVNILVWDLETGEELYRYQFSARFIASGPDGRTFLSSSGDTTLRLWELNNGAEIRRFAGERNLVKDVAYSPDGKTALSTERTAMHLWDLETGAEIRRFIPPGTLASVTYSPDGQTALSTLFESSLTLWDLATGDAIRHLAGSDSSEGHVDWVFAVAFSPDGRTALSGAQGDKNHLILWDLGTGEPIRYFDTDSVLRVAISPDGRIGVSAGDGMTVWDLESGEQIRRLEGHTNIVWGVAFSPDGRTVLSGSDDTTLILWDLETGEAIRRFLGHSGGIKRVALSPDGRTALSASRDATVILWDVQTGEALRRYVGHSGQVGTVAFSPDGLRGLSGGGDGRMIEWRIDRTLDDLMAWVNANRYVRDLTCSERASYGVEPLCEAAGAAPTPTLASATTILPTPTFSPAASSVAATQLPTPIPTPTAAPVGALTAQPGENRGEIPLGGGQVWAYAGQAGERLSIRVSADQPASGVWGLAAQLERGALDTRLIVYAPDGEILAEADDIQNGLDTDALIEDLTLTAAGQYRIEVRSYAEQTGGAYTLVIAPPRITRFRHTAPAIHGLAISPDGRAALAGGGSPLIFNAPAEDNSLILWNLETGEVIHRFEGHTDAVGAVAISPDGRTALSGARDSNVILWDLATGKEIRRLDGHTGRVSGAAFSSDGRAALTAADDGISILWDVATGEPIRRFEGHSSFVNSVAFTPDGRHALSTSNDRSVIVWDVATGEAIQRFEPFMESLAVPVALAIRPDGRTALVGGGIPTLGQTLGDLANGAALILLEIETGKVVRRFEGHRGFVLGAAFSPDGRYALSSGNDHSVRLWDIETGAELARFEGHTGEVWRVAFSPDGRTAYSSSLDGTLRVWDFSKYLAGP